jgi:3-(3-hydroxy-phenyl)propionate hydroxylase
MNSPSSRQFDVIISGAGPVGCTIALILARRGYTIAILEGEASLPLDLRASTFHPPTLDMLDSLGVTERLLPMGLVAPTYQYRDRRTGDAAIFDLGLIRDSTRHPYRLQCEQFKLTQLVHDLLKDMPNVEFHFDHRVEQVLQDADGVTVHAERLSDGFRSFRGRYCIGADGANSRVRKSQAIDFQGFTWPERFLVVSTPEDFARDLPNLCYVNYVSDPDEWCVLLRTVTLWRVLVPTAADKPDAEVLSNEYAQGVLHRIVDRAGPYPVNHRTLYRVHQRVARTYRVGRVLLAGDAAHINNPLGGMGMNGGLHDAFNLAEKLEQVLAGRAPDSLLDRYDRQRREICVKFVQEQTIANKKMIEEHDPERHREHMQDYKRRAADPELARPLLLRTSMITGLREAEAIQ